VLEFSDAEVRAFVRGVKAGEFDRAALALPVGDGSAGNTAVRVQSVPVAASGAEND
jgi:hypothetical protein